MNILRQDVLFIYLDTQEFFDRCRVFGAIQTLDRYVARGDRAGMRVQCGFHPGGEGVNVRLGRLGITGRGHQSPAQFAQRLLPNFRIGLGVLDVQSVKRQTAGFQGLVVAIDAIGVDHRTVRVCRGLSEGSRQDQDP